VGFPINAALDTAFARALSLNPNERFRTVGEFAAAITMIASPRSLNAGGGEQTMAFPASAFEPPPGGLGSPAPSRGPDGGYPPAPSPMGLQQPAQAQPPMPPPPPQASAPSRPPGRDPMMQTHVPSQSSPERSSSRGKAATIAVIVAGVFLLGGAIAVIAIVRGKSNDSGQTTASASASAPTPPPAASEQPPPVASTEPTAAPSADVDAGPPGVEVTITCVPGCDELKVDGKPIDDPTKPLSLQPGQHRLVASKEGFFPRTELVSVAAGKPVSREIKLVEKGAVPQGAGPAKAPCKRFLGCN
jgi:hypothetical protein